MGKRGRHHERPRPPGDWRENALLLAIAFAILIPVVYLSVRAG